MPKHFSSYAAPTRLPGLGNQSLRQEGMPIPPWAWHPVAASHQSLRTAGAGVLDSIKPAHTNEIKKLPKKKFIICQKKFKDYMLEKEGEEMLSDDLCHTLGLWCQHDSERNNYFDHLFDDEEEMVAKEDTTTAEVAAAAPPSVSQDVNNRKEEAEKMTPKTATTASSTGEMIPLALTGVKTKAKSKRPRAKPKAKRPTASKK